MKRRFTRIVAAFLAFLLLLPACGKEKKQTEPGINEETEITDPNILTHIYRETARTGEGVRTETIGIQPYYDQDTKTLTFVAEETDSEEDEDDISGYSVRVLSQDGSESEITSFSLKNQWIRNGFIENGSITTVVFQQDENGNRRGRIGQYDLNSGEWTLTEEDILSLFSSHQLGMRGPVRDAAGNYCVAAENGMEFLVLSPEGKLIRAFTPVLPGSGSVDRIVASEDGRVFASFMNRSSGTAQTAEIFPEDGKIGELWHTGNQLFGGSDGIPFFYRGDEGIYAKSPDGGRDKLLLNYVNSNMSWAEDTPFFVSSSAVFVLEMPAMGNRFLGGPLVCYVPADDIDIREQKILNLVYFNYLTTSAAGAIKRFNRLHPDVRIVAEDWESYNTTENPRGGYDKLCMDMVTGRFVPDILIGAPEDPHITAAYEHSLYTDLTPFLESDDHVTPDNLFGCVKRLFDDGQGGLWGITPNFTIAASLVSTRELIGEYADKGYWTIGETLDYIESIPEDCEFLAEANRPGLPLLDAGDGYMVFVDREAGTCSFDSPGFIRYLEYAKALRSLPVSPYAGQDSETLAKPRMDGKIRAAGIRYITGVDQIRRLMMLYSTKDWTMIGYPAPVERAGAGTPVSTQFAMMITSACEDPELAWEVIRQCFTSDDGQGGIPALKSTLEGMVEGWYGKQFEDYYILHDYVYMYRDADHAIDESDLRYPGILSTFEREDRDKYVALFDEIGTSASERGIREIRDILYEEASSFFSGLGSAEDCAAKIQSRVSIWLAEHK